MPKRGPEDILEADETERKHLKENHIEKGPSGSSGSSSKRTRDTVYVVLYKAYNGYESSTSKVTGVFSDMAAANKAAVKAYKKFNVNWASTRITDLGVTDNPSEPDVYEACKSYNHSGRVRYVLDEECEGMKEVVVKKFHVRDTSEIEDEDEDLPYGDRIYQRYLPEGQESGGTQLLSPEPAVQEDATAQILNERNGAYWHIEAEDGVDPRTHSRFDDPPPWWTPITRH